tara:strand:+ start:152 stop:844 length:693 start_codon:yes stop_codon:yes gene_type:complete
MVNRVIIHIRNLMISISWIFNYYSKFSKNMELRGYYSLGIYKIWLWKEDARYFTAYDISGTCFFIKMKPRKKIEFEYSVNDYINQNYLEKIKFYPQIVDSCTSDFFYNVYEYIDGSKISKSTFSKELVNQIYLILIFFKKHKIIHRDIRPHNLILYNDTLKIIDFEHCSINNKTIETPSFLNSKYRFSNKVWDDAFSFKKIIDQYCSKKKIADNDSYKQIKNMIGELIYE